MIATRQWIGVRRSRLQGPRSEVRGGGGGQIDSSDDASNRACYATSQNFWNLSEDYSGGCNVPIAPPTINEMRRELYAEEARRYAKETEPVEDQAAVEERAQTNVRRALLVDQADAPVLSASDESEEDNGELSTDEEGEPESEEESDEEGEEEEEEDDDDVP